MIRRRNLLIAICTFSAGVHLAITPEHLHEALPLGVSFILATCALTLITLGLVLRPASMWPPRTAALVFAGMIAAYAATRATEVPGIADTPEAVDVVGVITKVAESAGLLLAVSMVLHRTRPLFAFKLAARSTRGLDRPRRAA